MNLAPVHAARLLLMAVMATHSRGEFRTLWPDSTGFDDHGRGEGSEEWPKGLKQVSGAKGSNPGGLHEDETGQKWYVKHYKDPGQAATEHVSNAVYKAVGIDAPHSVLGSGGDYASKWEDGGKTLGKVGLNKERADAILDGFAADVFLDNWDAVGTGHDNILVKGSQVTRVDQGGTLLYRAQGALKPEAGLEKVGEWDSLVSQNHYYAQVFKSAGVKNGDALGERGAKQIDRIVAARPKDGWKGFVDRTAPKAPAAFREKVGKVLEARQKGLERKRDELRGVKTLAEFRALWPNAEGHDDHGRDYEPTSLKPLKGRDIREALSNVYPPVVEAYGKVQEIDPREVMSGQKTVNPARVSEYKNNPGREADRAAGRGNDNRLLVARRNGKLAVIDGNHRIAGALARGDTSIKATVIDMDAATADAERGRQSGEGFGLAIINAANRKLRGLADWNEDLHPRDDKGKFSDSGDSGGGIVVKQKAAPATKDQIAKAVEMKKAGHSYAKIQAETGLNPKQAATIVFKANKKEKELAEALKTGQPATGPKGWSDKQIADFASTAGPGQWVNDGKGDVMWQPATAKNVTGTGHIKAPTSPFVGQAGWSTTTTMADDGTVINAKGEKLAWKEKTTGAKENIGKYAYYKDGVQVSAPMPKGDYLKAAATINQGKGPDYAAPKADPYAVKSPYEPPAPKGFHIEKGTGSASDWPISDSTPRQMGTTTPAALEKKGNQWATELSASEKIAVREYTGSSYIHINEDLRNGAPLSGHSAKISTAIDKYPSPPPPELVWRGTSNSGVGSVASTLGPGDVVQLNGFQSTSIKPEFAHSWGGGKTLFEIKPSKGAYVRVISHHKSEYEYLLPHGHKYTVAGVKNIKFGSSTHKVIQLEMHK